MRLVMSSGLAIMLVIVFLFANFNPSEQYPTRESTIDHVVATSDVNISRSLENFKDINAGQNNTSLGKGIYHFATAIKHDFYSLFYFGAFIAEQYPYIIENLDLIIIIIMLILVMPILPITVLILLGIILIAKERFFKTEDKLNGVWKNGKKLK